jgi:hypothetical protein
MIIKSYKRALPFTSALAEQLRASMAARQTMTLVTESEVWPHAVIRDCYVSDSDSGSQIHVFWDKIEPGQWVGVNSPDRPIYPMGLDHPVRMSNTGEYVKTIPYSMTAASLVGSLCDGRVVMRLVTDSDFWEHAVVSRFSANDSQIKIFMERVAVVPASPKIGIQSRVHTQDWTGYCSASCSAGQCALGDREAARQACRDILCAGGSVDERLRAAELLAELAP